MYATFHVTSRENSRGSYCCAALKRAAEKGRDGDTVEWCQKPALQKKTKRVKQKTSVSRPMSFKSFRMDLFVFGSYSNPNNGLGLNIVSTFFIFLSFLTCVSHNCARYSYRLDVCPSVCPSVLSVRHTLVLCRNGSTYRQTVSTAW